MTKKKTKAVEPKVEEAPATQPEDADLRHKDGCRIGGSKTFDKDGKLVSAPTKK